MSGLLHLLAINFYLVFEHFLDGSLGCAIINVESCIMLLKALKIYFILQLSLNAIEDVNAYDGEKYTNSYDPQQT